MAKRNKVGVNFKYVGDKIYCRPSFKGKTTRFPYPMPEEPVGSLLKESFYSSIEIYFEKEKVFVEKCIRYLDSKMEEFSFSGFGIVLNDLKKPINSIIDNGLLKDLGNIQSVKKNSTKSGGKSTLYF